MKSRTVRGSAFLCLPAQTCRAIFALPLPQLASAISPAAQSGITKPLLPPNKFTAQPPQTSSRGATFCLISAYRPKTAPHGKLSDMQIYIFLCGQQIASYSYSYIFLPSSCPIPQIPTITAPVASKLTQQVVISGMNPAVNAVQVFRQILPSEATNQMSKGACR